MIVYCVHHNHLRLVLVRCLCLRLVLVHFGARCCGSCLRLRLVLVDLNHVLIA